MARKSRKGLAARGERPTAPAMRVWRAALYIRLSVEFNGRRGDSLETQRQIMEAHLALRPDIEIVEVFTDNGISGQIFERKAFQRMLEWIEDGRINCVVVKDLSRLGRNTIDTGYYIEKYFPLHQVRFIAVNDQYDSEDADNCGSHITVPLKNMINEVYAADIAQKVRSQLHQSMRDGDFVGARPPYGYKKAPDNCHKLLVNEDTAPVVRQIFDWTAHGTPMNVVVKKLNEAGVLTPGFYLASCGMIQSQRLMGSGKWQTWTVAKILEDEVYVGDMVQGKHKTVNKKQVLTPPEEWTVVRNTHEPLVSRELFAQVQALREQQAAKHTRAAKIPYTENILRGRIFCAHCGKNLHRQKNHGVYLYHCISNDRIAKGACEGGVVRIRENDLFSAILDIVRQEAAVVIGNRLRLAGQDGKLIRQRAETRKEISALQEETRKSRGFLTSLLENLMKGIITAEEYRSMKAGYEDRIKAAVGRSQQLQARQEELDRQLTEYVSLASRLEALEPDAELTARLVEQLIDRITMDNQNRLSIRFSFEGGFDRVAEVLGDG